MSVIWFVNLITMIYDYKFIYEDCTVWLNFEKKKAKFDKFVYNLSLEKIEG